MTRDTEDFVWIPSHPDRRPLVGIALATLAIGSAAFLVSGPPGPLGLHAAQSITRSFSPALLKRQPALLTLLGDPMSPQHTLRRLSFGIQASGNGQRRLSLERPSQRRLSLARQEPNTLLLCRGRELFEERLRARTPIREVVARAAWKRAERRRWWSRRV